MKIKLFAPLLGMILSVSAAAADASSKDKVSVQASRDVRVTIVDQNKSEGSRDAVYAALTKSLTAGLTHESKLPVTAKTKTSSASKALKELQKGECDALIVIGNSVPSVLLKDGIMVLKADSARTSELSDTFYLLGHPRDQGLNKVLALAFDHAIKSTAFQQAVVGKTAAKADLAAADR